MMSDVLVLWRRVRAKISPGKGLNTKCNDSGRTPRHSSAALDPEEGGCVDEVENGMASGEILCK